MAMLNHKLTTKILHERVAHTANSSTLNGDDVGRLSCGAAIVQEGVIVVCDKHTGDDNTKDVENGDSPKDTSHGLCDVAARVLRL